MKQYRLFILEDEPKALHLLMDFLEGHEEFIIPQSIATSYEMARDILKTDVSFDVSILDCKLGKKWDVFDLVNVIDVKKLGIRVFTTQFKLDLEDVGKTLDLSPDIILPKPPMPDYFDTFLAKLDKAYASKIAKESLGIGIKTATGHVFLRNEEILYVTTKRTNYALFCCVGDLEFETKSSLDNLESLLNPKYFARCNKSHIVNIENIKRVGSNIDNDSLHFHLTDDHKPEIFVTYSSFKDLLKAKGF